MLQPVAGAESEGLSDSRERDARVAALIAAGRSDSSEVRAWVTDFHRRVLAYCRKWRHSPDDAAELVQGFWQYAFEKKLFAKYSPSGGRLLTYLSVCFRNYFFETGKQIVDRRRREESADSLVARSDGPPADALQHEVELRRALKCLAQLGLSVGETGWLFLQRYVEERSYKDLAEQLFAGSGAEERQRQAGMLRQRVFDAKAPLRRCLGRQDRRAQDGTA
jgi:DNA-directed RNA polymerase specialized sigma24 family protein